jgi:hypothetical protein
VAAYRELHNVHSRIPAAIPDAGSTAVTGDARTAVVAWHRARAIADEAKRQTLSAGSLTRDIEPDAQRGVER